MLGPDPDRPPGAPSTPYGVNHTSRLSAGPEAIAGANDALAALAPEAGAPRQTRCDAPRPLPPRLAAVWERQVVTTTRLSGGG